MVTLREEYKLEISENKVIGRIFASEKDEETICFRISCNE
jgi:hypothetical protein